MELKYESLEELKNAALKENMKISEIVLKTQSEDLGQTEEEILSEMLKRYKIMKQAAEEGLKPGVKSVSGITGGDAPKLIKQAEGGINICSPVFTRAMAYAVAVSEYNAAMGRIVAAPTAGSCGILPAVLISVQEEHGFRDGEIAQSMLTASAIGMVVAKNACIAGAQGGCQAECGTASAMAAGAVCELLGGSPETVLNAVAIAFKSVLGLVCDPVAGLVEVPCIKRNASGAATAFMAAQLAISGISSVIPADETVLAMKRIGAAMSPALKETAEGGLAATPAGCAISRRLQGQL